MENNHGIDANPSDLMGKYGGREKKKGKGGHRCRYRDDDNIEALYGIYKEPKDNNDDDRDNDGDWDDMEEKEREEDDDDENDVGNITVVQLFGMPDKKLLGKETENNKKKEEED